MIENIELLANPLSDNDNVAMIRYDFGTAEILAFKPSSELIAIGACEGSEEISFKGSQLCVDIAAANSFEKGYRLGVLEIKWPDTGTANIRMLDGNGYYSNGSTTISPLQLDDIRIGIDKNLYDLNLFVNKFSPVVFIVIVIVEIFLICYKIYFKNLKFLKLSMVVLMFTSSILLGLFLYFNRDLSWEKLLATNYGPPGECVELGESCLNNNRCCGNGICQEGLCLVWGTDNEPVYGASPTPIPQVSPHPDSLECTNFDWPYMNGYYCSATDPKKLVYCHFVEIFNNAKSYLDIKSLGIVAKAHPEKTKICDTVCIREPMSVDDHCQEDPAAPIDNRNNKFMEVKYDYKLDDSSYMYVFVKLLDNAFYDVFDDLYRFQVEVSEGAYIDRTDHVSAKPMGIFLLNVNNSMDTIFFPKSVGESDRFRNVPVLSVFYPSAQRVSFHDGKHYLSFKVYKGTSEGPVKISMSIRDKMNVYECLSDTLFDGQKLKSPKGDVTEHLSACNAVEVKCTGPECMKAPKIGSVDIGDSIYYITPPPQDSKAYETYKNQDSKDKKNPDTVSSSPIPTTTNFNFDSIDVEENNLVPPQIPLNDDFVPSSTPVTPDSGQEPEYEGVDVPIGTGGKITQSQKCKVKCEYGLQPDEFCQCNRPANSNSQYTKCGPIDVNGDKKLDHVDLASFVGVYGKLCSDIFVKGSNNCGGKDTNGDGRIDQADRTNFMSRYSYVWKPRSCV